MQDKQMQYNTQQTETNKMKHNGAELINENVNGALCVNNLISM